MHPNDKFASKPTFNYVWYIVSAEKQENFLLNGRFNFNT